MCDEYEYDGHVEWHWWSYGNRLREYDSLYPRDLARIFITGCPNRNFKNLGCPKSLIEKVKVITLIMYIKK